MRMPSYIASLALIAILGATTAAQTDSDVGLGDVLYGKAVYLPRPVYSAEARAARIRGRVQVSVGIGADGHVTWARAISGHAKLREPAEVAAMKARFTPTIQKGIPVSTSGMVTFNFIQTAQWENIGRMIGNLELGKLITADYTEWEQQIIEDVGKDAKKELFKLLKQKANSVDSVRAIKLATTLENILSKNEPIEAWYFQVGRTASRLEEFASKPELDQQFLNELQSVKILSETAPTAIPPYRVDLLVRIAVSYSSKTNLTRAEKHAITDLVNKSISSETEENQ